MLRLTLLAGASLFIGMAYFGRDSNLPEDRIGRDRPAISSQVPNEYLQQS